MKHQFSQSPKVSVIVAGCNEALWLTACFQTLERSEYPLDLIYVDSGSSDGSLQIIREHFPKVRSVSLAQFIGLAQANNIGARLALEAGATYLFFLNPDTKTPPTLIAHLVSFLEAHPDFAAIGPAQTKYDDVSRPNSWFEQALRRGECHEFAEWGVSPNASLVGLPKPQANIAEVSCVQGSVLFVRADVFQYLGGFDEFYETYFEDTDFCRRLRLSGFRAGLLLDCQIAHAHGGGSGTVPGRNEYRRVYFERNKYLFLWSDPEISVAKTLWLSFLWFASDLKDCFGKRQKLSNPQQFIKILISLSFRILQSLQRRRSLGQLPFRSVTMHQFQPTAHIVLCSLDYHRVDSGGGSATANKLLGEMLRQSGVRVSYITRGPKNLTAQLDGALHLQRRWGNAEWYCRRLHLPQWICEIIAEVEASYHFAITVRSIHRHQRVDMVEIGESGAMFVCRLFPTLVRLHGCASSAMANKPDFASRVRRFLQCHGMRQAKSLVAPSESYARIIRQELRLPSSRIQIISNLPPKIPEFDRPSSNGQFRFLYVGRIEESKGFSVLMQAYEQLAFAAESFRLDIVGELHPNFPECRFREFLHKFRQNVSWHGHVLNRDIFPYYQQADVVVLPSFHETFSYVTIEAMAAGCLVVASDIPALAELIRHGETGLLFRSRDAEHLKEQLLQCLRNLGTCKVMGKAAQIFFKRNFNAITLAEQNLRLYEQTLGNSKKFNLCSDRGDPIELPHDRLPLANLSWPRHSPR